MYSPTKTKIKTETNIDYSQVAKMASGASGAELACSAETQTRIDEKVVELVKAQHEKAIKILRDNREKLDEAAQYLYKNETITGDEFMKILNG